LVTQPKGCHSEPTAKNLASVVGRHFTCHFGGEGSHNRTVGTGFSGAGRMGNETAR